MDAVTETFAILAKRGKGKTSTAVVMAEVLIALGMTGPRDVAAIDEWVRLHADEDEARQVKASLPSLPVGTAWVWSPGWRARLTTDHPHPPKETP